MSPNDVGLVLVREDSYSTRNWLDIVRGRSAMETDPSHPRRDDLPHADELTTRLRDLIESCRTIERYEPTARRPEERRRRRWRFVLDDGFVMVLHEMIEPNGEGATRRLETLHPTRPAMIEIKGRSHHDMLPSDPDAAALHAAIMDCGRLAEASLDAILDPAREDDPTVLPYAIEAAAACIVMETAGTPEEATGAPDDEGVRWAGMTLPCPWRGAMLPNPFDRTSVDAPSVARVLPVSHTISACYQRTGSKEGVRRAEMSMRPSRITAELDVDDPLKRMRLLAALHALRPRDEGT